MPNFKFGGNQPSGPVIFGGGNKDPPAGRAITPLSKMGGRKSKPQRKQNLECTPANIIPRLQHHATCTKSNLMRSSFGFLIAVLIQPRNQTQELAVLGSLRLANVLYELYEDSAETASLLEREVLGGAFVRSLEYTGTALVEGGDLPLTLPQIAVVEWSMALLHDFVPEIRLPFGITASLLRDKNHSVDVRCVCSAILDLAHHCRIKLETAWNLHLGVGRALQAVQLKEDQICKNVISDYMKENHKELMIDEQALVRLEQIDARLEQASKDNLKDNLPSSIGTVEAIGGLLAYAIQRDQHDKGRTEAQSEITFIQHMLQHSSKLLSK